MSIETASACPKATSHLPGPTDTVAFGPVRVSRLMVGHNPVCGNSHASDAMNAEMSTYFTADNVVAMYKHAESLGIKTAVVRGDYTRLGYLELYRRAGGTMNVICQTASEMHDIFRNIRVCAAAGADAIYHHGTQTDRFWMEGKIDKTADYLKCMRDCGVAVGLCSHKPEIIDYAQQKQWDVDFLMCCFYDPGKGRIRQSAIVNRAASADYGGEVYDDADRDAMCRVIAAAGKPVLAFKILAATRKCKTQEDVQAAYHFAYSHIRPTDAVAVGFFPKHLDQIRLGIQYASDACRSQH